MKTTTGIQEKKRVAQNPSEAKSICFSQNQQQISVTDSSVSLGSNGPKSSEPRHTLAHHLILGIQRHPVTFCNRKSITMIVISIKIIITESAIIISFERRGEKCNGHSRRDFLSSSSVAVEGGRGPTFPPVKP